MFDTALHFSGGKDSIACLYLLKPRWHEIFVVWVNTGAAHPDIVEYMGRWKTRVPHFVEVNSDQPADLKERGWPSDVVPVENTAFGKAITGNTGPMIQAHLDCCAKNVWAPLHEATKKLGVKYVIKGQRKSDRRKSLSSHGSSFDGLTYLMPIEEWSDEDVFDYLKEVNADMPVGYSLGEKTGRDCWDCTAFLDENRERIANLPAHMREVVEHRLALIRAEIQKAMP